MSVSLRFSISRGCLVLKGSTINCLGEKWLAHCMSRCSDDERERLGQASAQRLQRDGDAYHITIISAPEMKALASCDSTLLVQSLNSSLLLKQSTLPLYDLGVGCYNDQCYYIILYSPFLQKTRLQLNLPPVDLHITLAFHQSDVHDVRKGFSTLWREKMTPEGRNQDNTNDSNTLVKFLTTIEQILQAKSTPKVREYLEYSRLAEVASRYGYLFGVYYLAKYCHHNNSVSSSCDVLEEAICDVNHCKVLKSKTASSTVSSTGPEGDVIDYGELVCKALNFQLYSPARCQHRLRRFYSSVIDINRYDISYVEMPRNFSFITDNVAGSSLPDTRQALTSLVAIGITDIITVMEKPLDKASTAGVPLDYHWFQVNDRTPPSVDQMRDMMGLLDRPGRKTLVHCLGGVGRTATVLGAYLMWSQGLSRQEAKQPLIENRRTILAPSQEEFLTSWYSTCLDHRTRTAATSTTAATTTNDTSIVKPLARTQTQAQAQTTKSVVKFPPLLMCVGYPASGKSTFAEALCASNPDRFIRINQDESGRKECEANISKFVKLPNKTVILDRCNLTCAERKEWLALAHHAKAWVVFFSTPIEECKWRIVRRVGHPTLKNGKGGRVLDSLDGVLEAPNLKTESFEQTFEVHSFDASNALLKAWGCESEPVSTIPEELGMLKFPRTRHLCNLGSATRDDLIISPEDVNTHFLHREVYIEEKIDGANMGISIRDNQLCAQNRSHYVSSEYHPQFKHLDKWLYQHSAVLWELLQSDRYILYGEWCFAKHSIPYTALSDWFTAFDLFDRLENKFWSRSRLASALQGTGIALIPLIAKGTFTSIEELKNFIQTKSQYYDGPVEGIVVRVNDPDDLYVESRGKIVRADFLSGDTHWSKYGCSPNTIIRTKDTY